MEDLRTPKRPRAASPPSAGSDFSAAGSGRVLVAVTACMTVFGVTLGLSYPLLSLSLESRGVPAALNGLSAAMTPLGLIVVAPLLPGVVRLVGTWRFAVGCVAASALLLALLKLFDSLASWFVLRFLLGLAAGGLFAVCDAAIAALAGRSVRARVVAIYSSLLALGFAAGPFFLGLVGSQGWPPFLLGIGCALAGLIPLLAARKGLPSPAREDASGLIAFMPLAPTLLLAVGVFAVFDTAAMALFPLYGLRHGFDESLAVAALTALLAGNILLQYPIGWIADRLPRRRVMIGCAVLTTAGGLVVPLVLTSWLMWPLLALWGATAAGIYTLALAELGDRFAGARLLAGSAAFAAVWGLGGMLGPPAVGAAMDLAGPSGLPWSLSAAYLLLIGMAAVRHLQGRRKRRGLRDAPLDSA